MAHAHPIHGTPGDDVVFVAPGETYNGGAGDDTITAAFSPPPYSLDPETVFGGPGNDRLVDSAQSETLSVPVTLNGGPGDDVLVSTFSVGLPGHEVFTGGPGHDLFEFLIAPGSYAHIVTDFSRHDAIQIDGGALTSVTFTDHGDFTEMVALQSSAGVVVDLQGHFDPAQFHTTDDGAGHTIITYGNSDFLLS